MVKPSKSKNSSDDSTHRRSNSSEKDVSGAEVGQDTPPATTTRRKRTQRIFWKGAIHWMNRVNSHFRFDVDAENLVGTPLPSNPNTLPEDKICYLGECGGDLLLIQTRMYYAMKFRILEMDRDFSVLGVVKSANGEDVLVLAITGNFVLYNLNRKH
ncbi:uncharacterized protein LOC130779843 isoform X1 [Actinidia eriantha]|uniref:uncharacterized protein LOC130779843 isoform X1 n=1 Tax=Actinidia eriantha TaxID=165200 RepID=UPI0025884BC9|nr:uncharacterized protein LOC130779843 isoform X1 [Actinidia eriantha]